MKLYHGSKALFDRPSNDKILEGLSNSEFGFGFNTSTYEGDAIGHATTGSTSGVVYEYDLDDGALVNWLKSGESIGQDIHDRIIANKSKLPNTVSQKAFSELTPNSDGYRTHMILGGRTREGTDFLKQCGIDGALNGEYAIFFDANSVPEQKIKRVIGDFPAAEEALARQRNTGNLTVEQPVKADGTIVGPRRDYGSEELTHAAREIHKTGDRTLITAFEEFSTTTLNDPEITKSGGDGFAIRNNYGSAILRSFNDGGETLTDQWSGANTFARTNDWVSHTSARDSVMPTIQTLQTALQSHLASTQAQPTATVKPQPSPHHPYTV